MILKYYKIDGSYDHIKDELNTGKEGTTALDIVNTFNKLGFESSGLKININDFNKNLVPFIAYVNIDNKFNHYVVVYKITKEYIYVADPSTGYVKHNYLDFDLMFLNVVITALPKNVNINFNKDNLILYIVEVIKKNSRLFFILIFTSLIIIFLRLIYSTNIKFILEITEKFSESTYFIFIVYFIILLIKYIFNYINNHVINRINSKLNYSLTRKTIKDVISLPYKYFASRTASDVFLKINEVNEFNSKLISVFNSLFSYIPTSLLFLFLIYMNFREIFFYIVSCSILIIILKVFYIKYYNNNIDEMKNLSSIYSGLLYEGIESYQTIKNLNVENILTNKILNGYISLNLKSSRLVNVLMSEGIISGYINKSIVFFIFIILLKNKMTISNIIFSIEITNLYINYFTMFVGSVSDYFNIVVIYNRLNNLYVIENLSELVKISQIYSIVLNNFSFSHVDFNIKNISMTFKSGDKTCLVGKSGSGKSTIIKCLMKYFESRGISINGIDISNIEAKSIRDRISYVSQSEYIYTDTLLENIKMSRNISNEDILKVTRLVYLEEVIMRSNLGYHKFVQDKGFNYSGGEKQRIVLARSLLTNFDVLIIDEGLSEVDVRLEKNILLNIFKEFPLKTIIFITHRLDNISMFDKVINIGG